jgi:hypothetical protein
LSRELTDRFAAARIVVVAGQECRLVSAIARMGVADIVRVERLDVAQRLCDVEGADACIVVLPKAIPDERPAFTIETEAPGRGRVPALLVAEAVTPYIRKCARAAGYQGAIPLGLSPRTLYRCIGALLQASRRASGAGASRPPVGWIGDLLEPGSEAAGLGKPRLQ